MNSSKILLSPMRFIKWGVLFSLILKKRGYEMSLYELYDYLGLVLILLAIGRRSHDFFSMKMKEGMGMSHKKRKAKSENFYCIEKKKP